MKTFILILTAGLLATSSPAPTLRSTQSTTPAQAVYAAQSCVYFCRETGAVGYAHGGTNTCQLAYNTCKNYGGQYPQQVFSHYGSGYAAVALGTNAAGGRVIGAAAGFASQYAADQRARQECMNRGGSGVYVHDQWYVE